MIVSFLKSLSVSFDYIILSYGYFVNIVLCPLTTFLLLFLFCRGIVYLERR
uniref:Uncharacterized protein n=1 Tax=Siphoviridae sp. ct1TR2 TaxID=2825309 RepID=A0A8S5NSL5_9CAUD|nr:MAG TPA: hypothetical protein [Siphoviridae sp. ct1TR2]